MTAPPGAGPNWLFLRVDDRRVVKNRIHFDFRPDDQPAEVERLLKLGARHVDIGQGASTVMVRQLLSSGTTVQICGSEPTVT